ncbi:MAG: amidohydrolase family protein [Pseudolabrys sp.]
MKRAIVNIGCIVSGDWRKPLVDGDAILIDGEKIAKVGSITDADLQDCDLVIDANGVTACPGLIDSHVHIAFGDFTPRLNAVGFLQNYLHGGTTTAISACEVHVPGTPHTVEGVKALAVAAKQCWDNLRPGGMRVHGGNVILEPGMTEADFKELAAKGIWLAKAGFGDVKTPFDYVPLIQAAKNAGMITNVHTGGASLNLANSIFGKHLVAMQPDVSFHVNGGPIAMPDEDFEMVIDETKAALQIVQAGNIRTALLTLNLVLKKNCYDRLLIATDTPTATGVMPQGMIKTIAEMSCLSDLAPEMLIAAATGNNAKVYRLNSGFLQPGKDADILLLDAALGGSKKTALEGLKNGDVTSCVCCFTSGVPRYVGRSRCTPPPARYAKIIKNKIINELSAPPLL